MDNLHFLMTNTSGLCPGVVYWGYPRNMRGNHFVNILKHIDDIEEKLEELKQTKEPTIQNFNDLKKVFNKIAGLGLSTYSKLLYFFELAFENNPCLILDQRLLDIFSSEIYSEFQELKKIRYGKSAESKYLDYLKLVNQISIKLKTKGENIEQFLFIFGNNLSNKKQK